MRKTAHMERKEPILEYLLSYVRFSKAYKFIDNNAVIADIGCGYRGNLLANLSKKIKVGVGYDISVNTKGLPKNIRLVKTDINRIIDTKKNYFDNITALAVLEHVENPEIFLKKIKIMLKKGGKVILTTPHKSGKVILETLSKIGLISSDEIDDHKNYFDKKSLSKLFRKSGFKIVKVEQFGLGWLNLVGVAKKIN